MSARKSIFDAVETINRDCAFKLDRHELKKKIAEWHIWLVDINDEGIARGLEKEMNSPTRDFPRVGVFRALCIKPQTLALVTWEQSTKDIVNNKKNRLKILSNLKLVFSKNGKIEIKK